MISFNLPFPHPTYLSLPVNKITGIFIYAQIKLCKMKLSVLQDENKNYRLTGKVKTMDLPEDQFLYSLKYGKSKNCVLTGRLKNCGLTGKFCGLTGKVKTVDLPED